MFALHPTLAADTVELVRWPLCRVLLMDETACPWLILVPARPGLVEMHDLAAADRAVLIEEIADASRRLADAVGAYKINVGALGNVVPQLHIHVVARFRDDPAWPRPLWGAVPRTPHEPEALSAAVSKLREALLKS